jgi:hypothetical protein
MLLWLDAVLGRLPVPVWRWRSGVNLPRRQLRFARGFLAGLLACFLIGSWLETGDVTCRTREESLE